MFARHRSDSTVGSSRDFSSFYRRTRSDNTHAGSFYQPEDRDADDLFLRPKLYQRVSGAGEKGRISFSLSQHLENGLLGSMTDSDSDGGEDEDIVTEFVPFASGNLSATPSSLGLKVSRRKVDLETKLNVANNATTSSSKPRLKIGQPTNGGLATYDVIVSKYDAQDGGMNELTAILVHASSVSTSTMQPDGLFRWVHITEKATDFNKFCASARENAKSLGYEDVRSLDHFLTSVQRKFERSIRIHGDNIGKYMKQGCLTDNGSTDGVDDAPNKNFLFLSLHFYQLATHVYRPGNLKHDAHFPSTLLQNKYPHATKQRDLNQAVCSLESTLDGQCFYTPNFWCLMVDDCLMLTWAGGNSVQGVFGDVVKLQKFTPPTPPTNISVLRVVHLKYDGSLYIVPTSQCNTWFALMQTLSSISMCLEDQFYLKWNGIRILPELWTVLLTESKDSIIVVDLVKRRERIQHLLKTQSVSSTVGKVASQQAAVGEGNLLPIHENISRENIKNDELTTRERRSSFDAGHRSHDLQPPAAPATEAAPPRDAANVKPRIDKSPRREEKASRSFHMLIWLAMGEGRGQASSPSAATGKGNGSMQAGQQREPYQQVVQSYLGSLHTWLEEQSDPAFKHLYRKTDSKTFLDVERVFSGMKKARLDSDDAHELKAQFVDAVKAVFFLFLPLNQRCQVAGKVWGAVMAVVTGKVEEKDISQFDTAVTKLIELAVLAQTISSQLSHGKAPPPGSLGIPPAALRALYAFLHSIILWPYPYGLVEAKNYASRSFKLLTRSHRQLLRDPNATKLPSLESARPRDLVFLITGRLVQDITGTQPGVVKSYWLMLDSMYVPIQSGPLSRKNQERLIAFIDECQIVSQSLDDQRDAIRSLQINLPKQHSSARSYPVLQDALNLLEGKITSMKELIKKATELLEQSNEMHRLNKDKQEAAVYVFTIVTIIFLPISTVASVFGMNTQDIRNLESSQWIFWTVAMPLTGLVVIASLFFAGILPPPTQWIIKKVEYDVFAPSKTSKNANSSKKTTRKSSFDVSDTDSFT